MKNLNFFRASKFINEKFIEDKQKLTTFYNDNGFKDFTILSDSIYKVSEKRIGLKIRIDEGKQYFLRNVIGLVTVFIGRKILLNNLMSRKELSITSRLSTTD